MNRETLQFLLSYVAVLIPPIVFFCVKLYQAYR